MTEDVPLLWDQSVFDAMTVGVSESDIVLLLSSLEREIAITHQMINDAAVQNNWHMIEVKAHALKSAAASFGAMRLSAVCLRIEQNAQDHRSKERLQNQTEELNSVIGDTRKAFGWV